MSSELERAPKRAPTGMQPLSIPLPRLPLISLSKIPNMVSMSSCPKQTTLYPKKKLDRPMTKTIVRIWHLDLYVLGGSTSTGVFYKIGSTSVGVLISSREGPLLICSMCLVSLASPAEQELVFWVSYIVIVQILYHNTQNFNINSAFTKNILLFKQ